MLEKNFVSGMNNAENKLANSLPKMMPGSVHAQYVRCGKLNCKCARGELHGAYFYHFVRVNGCLRKRYLKASEVEIVKAACNCRRKTEFQQRDTAQQAMREWRRLCVEVREAQQILTNLSNV